MLHGFGVWIYPIHVVLYETPLIDFVHDFLSVTSKIDAVGEFGNSVASLEELFLATGVGKAVGD